VIDPRPGLDPDRSERPRGDAGRPLPLSLIGARLSAVAFVHLRDRRPTRARAISAPVTRSPAKTSIRSPALSASRAAFFAASRAPWARICAPMMRPPQMTSRLFVLMPVAFSARLARICNAPRVGGRKATGLPFVGQGCARNESPTDGFESPSLRFVTWREALAWDFRKLRSGFRPRH